MSRSSNRVGSPFSKSSGSSSSYNGLLRGSISCMSTLRALPLRSTVSAMDDHESRFRSIVLSNATRAAFSRIKPLSSDICHAPMHLTGHPILISERYIQRHEATVRERVSLLSACRRRVDDLVVVMQVWYGFGHEHAEACSVEVRVLRGRPDAGVSHYGAGPKLILPDFSDLSLALPSCGKCQEPPVGHGGIDIHADL